MFGTDRPKYIRPDQVRGLGTFEDVPKPHVQLSLNMSQPIPEAKALASSRTWLKYSSDRDEPLYPARSKDGNIDLLIKSDSDSALAIDKDAKTDFVYNRYHHLPLETQRQKLPIFQYRNHILYLLENHQTLVLVGETGSGKSTQIPQSKGGPRSESKVVQSDVESGTGVRSEHAVAVGIMVRIVARQYIRWKNSFYVLVEGAAGGS
ncbi:Probable ATP-dependent RNA helicase DHX35 [Eumeta japonica]|uniref:Probable ATP-dependent RNA helicase DHX35 n=1 Tax=Eumeta variegata TaxID=151549 RepID=A0A4C1Z6E0_EUMVA|nr:Probable ATP-dependent RNA helicase DHX35 [Eumeta japonica]